MTRIVKEPAERRLELIEAAKSLFEKKGYDSTAVSDIVKISRLAREHSTIILDLKKIF